MNWTGLFKPDEIVRLRFINGDSSFSLEFDASSYINKDGDLFAIAEIE